MTEPYVTDASGYSGWAERVLTPSTAEEVSSILVAAQESGVPVTIAAAGSGLTGGRVAHGGWVLSVEKFRDIRIGPGWAQAGVGVSLLELRSAAAQSRQFYAPDPTEIAAWVGGTIATNASGSRSFRFGSTRKHIRKLRVVHADGRIAEYQRGDKVDFEVPSIPIPLTTKCTAGYPLREGMDWIDLFCGSEGTLGVVIEAELQLLPLPAETFYGVVFFASDEDALAAVDEWRSVPALNMLEYADRNSLDLLRQRYPEIPQHAMAALLIEADGLDVESWERRLIDACALSKDSWFATSDRDRERFRKLRHSLPELVNATVIGRGFLKMGTDYAVPVDQNRAMLVYYRERLERELPGQYVIYGHIGDAHVHVNMLPSNQAQARTAQSLLTEFARQAVAFGGTVSAEHGLGKRKAHLLELQYAPADIAAMRAVKTRLDPQWILGRGTLFAPPAPD